MIFHRRCFHRLEAVALVDFADFLDHLPRGGDRGGPAILQPARQAGAEFLRFFGFFGHGRAWYQPTRMRQPGLLALSRSRGVPAMAGSERVEYSAIPRTVRTHGCCSPRDTPPAPPQGGIAGRGPLACRGHSTFLIQLCGSGARPYWMSTSFLRIPMARGRPPPLMRNCRRGTNLADRRDHGRDAQAKASFSFPLAASLRHCSIV